MDELVDFKINILCSLIKLLEILMENSKEKESILNLFQLPANHIIWILGIFFFEPFNQRFKIFQYGARIYSFFTCEQIERIRPMSA